MAQAQLVAKRQEVENGRQAATMYFTNLAALRNKDNLSPCEKERFARDLEIVVAISGNDDLKDIMTRASRDAAVSVSNETPQESAAKGGAIQALPDLVALKAAKNYTAADFLAYPEVPASRWNAEMDDFRSALTSIGFGT